MVPDEDGKKCFAHFHRSRIGFQPPIIFLVICNKASQLNGQSSILLEIEQLCLLLYMVGCDLRFFLMFRRQEFSGSFNSVDVPWS